MDSHSRNAQPFSGEPHEEFSSIFGLPTVQDTVYLQGSHENTFDHQRNLNTGNHMPHYSGDQVVSVPQQQWGGPSSAWNHPNNNASETYGSSAVSHYPHSPHR